MDPDHLLRQVHSQPVLPAFDFTETAWALQWVVAEHLTHLEMVSVVLKYPTSHWLHAVPVAPVGHVLHVLPTQKLAHVHWHALFTMDADVAWLLQNPAAVHSEHAG